MATEDVWEVEHLSEFLERESPTEEIGYGKCSLLSVTWYMTQTSPHSSLCGSTLEDETEIRHWIMFYLTRIRGVLPWQPLPREQLFGALKELNSHLSKRLYVSGSGFSLSDILLFYGLHKILINMSYSEKMSLVHICRWFDQIQHYPKLKPFSWLWVSCPKTSL
ncbi:PREDICTED: eukaryotic translation elongation factor 1 epsilon-1-like [Amphimedon queenslandica]|uniref:Nuclear-export cofactor Arc1-like N-terminal domain-containing protein n=2 Tax=Amphimedon queenslandica TaxID=400682 RepID=A0AAN0JE49_AMPQE|nr:PREDICTED: eukaryotic translation elongation factor 1 epsilon-1-like [Amphimedon queenslandica]|eukprot:XP_019855027.1 PREDICTED: eukaryotic translation elongation factor 1 epsilon-1-like [Amphimedon queenslandica]